MTTTTNRTRRGRLAALPLICATVGASILGGCGGSTNTTSPADTSVVTGGTTTGADAVLPVKDNPISNTATAKTLSIDSVLVENNEDANKKAVDDHLEVALSNTGSTDLSNVEVFTTFTDTKTRATESYYTKLPTDFSVPAGGSRTVHFDNTGATDHFPANKYSLYATTKNQLQVTVEVSAKGAAVQTATVKKDAGGAETPD